MIEDSGLDFSEKQGKGPCEHDNEILGFMERVSILTRQNSKLYWVTRTQLVRIR
jgi:hypothetical protein